MTEIQLTDEHLTSVEGISVCSLHAGIKKNGKKDLLLVYSEKPATAAAVFTKNKIKAAPIRVSMEHVAGGKAQALIVNSGCANACTGEQGLKDVETMAQLTAAALGIDPANVLVASTGTIGTYLPMEKVALGIRNAAAGLTASPDENPAEAIMTTDTVPKEVMVKLLVDDAEVRIGGIAKGAGMIHPNLATMLCFIFTDAAVSRNALDSALRSAVEQSFNMISIDADTSTNDMVSIMANGIAGNEEINSRGKNFLLFKEALEFVCTELAKKIARDGEGATKLIEVTVRNAHDKNSARKIARTIVSSNLIKTMVFGRDPNWGRVMMCIGNSGAKAKEEKIDVYFEGTVEKAVMREHMVNGGVAGHFSPDNAKRIMGCDEVRIIVDLNDGDERATAWGCDMTCEYVKINADYTT